MITTRQIIPTGKRERERKFHSNAYHCDCLQPGDKMAINKRCSGSRRGDNMHSYLHVCMFICAWQTPARSGMRSPLSQSVKLLDSSAHTQSDSCATWVCFLAGGFNAWLVWIEMFVLPRERKPSRRWTVQRLIIVRNHRDTVLETEWMIEGMQKTLIMMGICYLDAMNITRFWVMFAWKTWRYDAKMSLYCFYKVFWGFSTL